MIEQIKRKNENINSIIQKIVLELKQMKNKTIDIDNDKPYVTVIPKKILELEAKKIYMTYLAEFVDIVDDDKLKEEPNILINSYLSDEIDAHGFGNEVTFASGSSDYLSKLSIDFIGKEDRFKNLSDDEKIENNITVRDYITHLFLNNKQDMDFFLDALPHEVMHCFGFKGGNIFEGVTETFTREIAQKYGIRNVPFAHQDETKLVQRIEKIIGRDNLSRYSYFPDSNERVIANTLNLSRCIDSHISIDKNGILEEYENVGDELKKLTNSQADEQSINDIKEKLNGMYSELNSTYDEYINNHQESLYKLGQRNNPLDDKKNIDQQRKLEQVSELQDKEIEFLEYVYEELTNIREGKKDENKIDSKTPEIK